MKFNELSEISSIRVRQISNANKSTACMFENDGHLGIMAFWDWLALCFCHIMPTLQSISIESSNSCLQNETHKDMKWTILQYTQEFGYIYYMKKFNMHANLIYKNSKKKRNILNLAIIF
jgi:hypothetical protein